MSIDEQLKESAFDKIKEYGFEGDASRREFAKFTPEQTEAIRKRFRDDPEDEFLQRLISKLDS